MRLLHITEKLRSVLQYSQGSQKFKLQMHGYNMLTQPSLTPQERKKHWFLPGGKGVIGSLRRAGGPASELYQKEQLLVYISDNSGLTQLYITSKGKRPLPFFN